MKREYIQNLCLVLQVLSTYQEAVTRSDRNDNTSIILLPTPSIPKSSNQHTLYVHGSTSTEQGYGNSTTGYSQTTDVYSHVLTSSSPRRTQYETVRNLFSSTASRNLFSNTTSLNVFNNSKPLSLFSNTQSLYQMRSEGIRSIRHTESIILVRQSSISSVRNDTMTHGLYPSAVDASTSRTILSRKSQTVQYTTMINQSFWSWNISSTEAGKLSTLRKTSSRTTALGNSESSLTSLYSTTIALLNAWSSRRKDESSSNNRFLLSTQTAQPSRIINVSLSETAVSRTEGLDRKTSFSFSLISSYMDTSLTSTMRNYESSKTTPAAISSSDGGSLISRHGNNSHLSRTVYLPSSTNKVWNSRIQPTYFQNISQTSSNNVSNNLLSTSFRRSILFSTSLISESNPTSHTQRSDYHSKIKSSHVEKIQTTRWGIEHKSQQITTEVHILSTSIVTTAHSSSGGSPTMPLYVLAISLPLAVVLGFTLAFVYFKRNKEDQRRVRYSVTVEIEESQQHELKRYSVIDLTAGINKDVMSGVESEKSSNTVLDQLDAVSVSLSDQNV